jgi:hypothetical protein
MAEFIEGNRRMKLDRESIFPDSQCVCNPDCDGCACPITERALRNIKARTWLNGPMTAKQREWCANEADWAGEGTYDKADLLKQSDRDLASDVLNAWMDYCRSQGML